MPMSRALTITCARLWIPALLALPASVAAQQRDSTPAVPRADSQPAPKPKPWYDRFTLRGYTQFRYDDLFLDDPDYGCSACDRGIGGVKDFSVRLGEVLHDG